MQRRKEDPGSASIYRPSQPATTSPRRFCSPSTSFPLHTRKQPATATARHSSAPASTSKKPKLLHIPSPKMVDANAHIRRGHPIMFGILILFSFIVAVIASALTHDYNKNDAAGRDTSQGLKDKVHFQVFTGWFSFLFCIVYLTCFLMGVGGVLTSIASHLVFLFLNWIFWVASAGSLTAQLEGGQDCGTSPLFYCNSLEALMAFDWMAFIVATIMLGVTVFIGAGAFRKGRSMKDELA